MTEETLQKLEKVKALKANIKFMIATTSMPTDPILDEIDQLCDWLIEELEGKKEL
jgi:hypothetical protein